MKSEILGVKAPGKSCTDKNCPFHGQLLVKPEIFEGIIIKRDTNKSATMEWLRSYYVPKYERYELRRSRIRVHNPNCLDAHVGQKVRVARTRPLSKTKHHVIIAVLGEGKLVVKEEIKKRKHESSTE